MRYRDDVDEPVFFFLVLRLTVDRMIDRDTNKFKSSTSFKIFKFNAQPLSCVESKK